MAMNTLCLIFATIVCGAASRGYKLSVCPTSCKLVGQLNRAKKGDRGALGSREVRAPPCKSGRMKGLEERCFQNGVYGILKRVDHCESIPKIRNTLRNLKIYGYDGVYPIICCFHIEQDSITTRGPVATTQRLSSSTSEYVPEVYDYITTRPVIDSCAPVNSITGVSTLGKTGQRAWDKCVEYQEKLIYPCEESVAIMGGLTRFNHCRHGTHATSSSYARREEYPHMALLGYKMERNGTAVWTCSGTLISEKFILTAARCRFRRKRSSTPLAMVGSLNGLQNLDKPQTHHVRRIIRHPQFRAPSWYHDIALVETVTTIILDQWTVPACLDVFSGEDSKVVATQWALGFDEVQTEVLKKLHRTECQRHLYLHRIKRRLRAGYNSTIQACYGSNTPAVNLQHYIGGPITIRNSRVSCMYDVVGVTSIKQHRRTFTTGIYTRVSNYVPWIETVVWPNTV